MDHWDIGRRRLASQRLLGERCATPDAVVRWMGALQAQAYGQAVWAIGLRAQGATLADVERAIADQRIILTWPLRGTLHAIPAEDARWMLTVSAPRTLHAARTRGERLGLDDATINRCAEIIHDALSGGKRLTRPAVMALLEEAGVSTAGQRGYHILWHLAHTGTICLGPREGTQQTVVLLAEWAPGARNLSRVEALGELARRYVTSHGPVTLADFARWAALTTTDARAGLHGAAPAVVVQTRGGTDYWVGAGSVQPGRPTGPHVCLLPGFDEYVLGYKDRTDVLAPEHAGRIVPGNNGIFLPTIVVDGQVAGTWTHTRGRSGLRLTLHPFTPLTVPRESLAAAAHRYSAFLGVPLAALDVHGG
ncbi:MAG: winged helix DNA-binding domain-containing protein [Chloroflexota bacterium]